MEASRKQNRIQWLDAVRGFALLAIVYGHASRDVGVISQAVYSFHVVLCILITGWLWHCPHSLGEHLKKTGRRLLIPYVFWSLVSMGIYLLLGNIAAGALGAEIYGLRENLLFMAKGLSLGNAPLWYLPFAFVSLLFLYFYSRAAEKIREDRKWKKGIILIFPAVFSFLTLSIYQKYHFRLAFLNLPFGIPNACFLFAFLWLGVLMGKYGHLPKGKKWILPALLLIVISIGSALKWNDEVEYMAFDYSNYGRNLPVFYGTAAVTSLGICWLTSNLPRMGLLSWFGRNAMAILVMHKFPVLFFQILLGDLGEKMGHFRFLLFLAVSLLSSALCCWAGAFLRRFLPFTLGEGK